MKFKVGDRVRIYGANTQDGTITGTVVELRPDDWILVKYDGGMPSGMHKSHHPKQCRRLVKKERRRVRLHYRGSAVSVSWCWPTHDPSNCDGCFEFIEVRRK
jgi:hypothetical protein